MSNTSLTPDQEREKIGQFVHDAYELEKKIYATRELREKLVANQKEYEEKEREPVPSPPKFYPMLKTDEYLAPMCTITPELENNKIAEIKAKGEVSVFPFAITGIIMCPIIAAILSIALSFLFALVGSLFSSNLWLNFWGRCFNKFIPIVIILFAIHLWIVITMAMDYSKNRKSIPNEIEQLKRKNQEYNEEAILFNSSLVERNKAIDNKNLKIELENEKIKEKNKKIQEQYERTLQLIDFAYTQKCKAYQAQIDQVSDSLKKLCQIRSKMDAFGILSPDYREMEHLHMIDHYFKNRLVDNMKEAISMYKEDEFRGIVGQSLADILSGIQGLTGEVRNLGLTLQSIQADMAVISEEVFRTRLVQEELLSETYAHNEAILQETRAQRYATEAVKKSTDRLVWYEQQEYYRKRLSSY